MKAIAGIIPKEMSQFLVYIGLSIVVLGLTGILYSSNPIIFRRFIGGINPLLAAFMIVILGAMLLSFLLSRGWFVIYQKEYLARLFRYSSLAAPFVIISILVDLKAGFPADLNVLFPKSLAFYPAIGFLVEILFHVLPLTIFLVLLTMIFKNISYSNIIWICILVVALLEPSYQTAPMFFSSSFPLWAASLVWLNIFTFNLAQFVIFKRYDFISMYAFRLVYYLVWHILWGYLRLNINFS